MCGRYDLVPDAAAWADVYSVLGDITAQLRAVPAKYNIAPTQQVAIVVHNHETGRPTLIVARWGYVPPWWKELKPPQSTINARSEEAAEKPMWRQAWRNQRCLLPATAWFEWQKASGEKIPQRLFPRGGHGFMFAGLWSWWTEPASGARVATCAILTTKAAPEIEHIHDRMPIVLGPQAWITWLDPVLTDPVSVKAMLERDAVRTFRHYRVSTRVNSPRNDDPGVIEPIDE